MAAIAEDQEDAALVRAQFRAMVVEKVRSGRPAAAVTADLDLSQGTVFRWTCLVATTCRWWHDEQLPNRDYWRVESIDQPRAAVALTRY